MGAQMEARGVDTTGMGRCTPRQSASSGSATEREVSGNGKTIMRAQRILRQFPTPRNVRRHQAPRITTNYNYYYHTRNDLTLGHPGMINQWHDILTDIATDLYEYFSNKLSEVLINFLHVISRWNIQYSCLYVHITRIESYV